MVAEGLGYKAKTELRSVEVFMHDYYLHARTVHSLYQRLGQRFREYLDRGKGNGSNGRSVGDGFILGKDSLAIDPGVRTLDDPRRIFEAFLLSAQEEVPLDFGLRAVIERSSKCVAPDMHGAAECTSMFRKILRSHSVARTLRDMNDLNVLGRFIPEFGELVAFFQHNVYHYFTADEHTLIALANAEKLRDEQGFMHEVFRNLRRKDLLYMAILLHDIAKPRGVADHEITGVEMSRVILERLGMDDLFPEIGFLVRNHLVMEQIAFRRNVHDPETLKEFAARFEKPHYLDYLYLLTYADLSAVNPGVWTEWKATMLQELYQRTAEVLARNLRGEQVDRFHHARREEMQERLIETLSTDLPAGEVKQHLQGMQNDSYFSLFTEEEIREHIVRSARGEPVSVMCVDTGGYTEVTVIARDEPFALSRFCAVLSANDANIFDANIFTRDDGIILDRFRVAAAGTRKETGCRGLPEDRRRSETGDGRHAGCRSSLPGAPSALEAASPAAGEPLDPYRCPVRGHRALHDHRRLCTGCRGVSVPCHRDHLPSRIEHLFREDRHTGRRDHRLILCAGPQRRAGERTRATGRDQGKDPDDHQGTGGKGAGVIKNIIFNIEWSILNSEVFLR